MRRILTTAGWAGLFMCFGAILFGLSTWLMLSHSATSRLIWLVAGIGALEALIPWSLCFCFGVLPWTLPLKAPPPLFSLGDAIGALARAALIMFTASLLPMLAPLNLGLFIGLHTGTLKLPNFSSPLALESSFLAGEIAILLWLSWLMRHLGPKATDGSPNGVAWRPASLQGYLGAVMASIGLLALTLLILTLLPPDSAKLSTMRAARLFSSPAWALAGTFGGILILAPIAEEILFRGLAFAGLAAHWGTGPAILLSCALFVAVHAPEKLHYWPGFVGVGALALAACWLRLRYRSIKPGVLMHILYNAGLLLAGPLLHWSGG
ncbi:lysostaphin resistance A-like protein [Acidocella sp.]|uniref:CPBP family intramembrane glutamic endopeptidase n=1 Tax=Acidocella sp. TaxID=50710 RepID=UPI003CFCA5FC